MTTSRNEKIETVEELFGAFDQNAHHHAVCARIQRMASWLRAQGEQAERLLPADLHLFHPPGLVAQAVHPGGLSYYSDPPSRVDPTDVHRARVIENTLAHHVKDALARRAEQLSHKTKG